MTKGNPPFESPRDLSSGITDRLFRPAHIAAAVALLLVVFGLEVFLSVRTESQTFDEPAHLYAGYSYWLHGDFGINPEHPPLVKLVAALPLLISRPAYPQPLPIYFRAASVVGGKQMMDAPDAESVLWQGRIAVSVFSFALALLVFFAAREIFSTDVALLALLLFVFSPIMISNAPLIGTDMGITCCMFAAVYAFYRYVKKPTLLRLALAALAAGLTVAAKHSAILLCPILVLLCVAEVVLNRPSAGEESQPRRTHLALRLGAAWLAISLAAIAILWSFYGFRYAARPNGGQITPPTAVYLQSLHQRFEADVIAFAEHHHLLPEAYLYGLTDVTILANDGRAMFLFGKDYPAGMWFYFPSVFLIKMTVGFLLLLALLPFARSLRRREYSRELLFLIVPTVFYFGMAMTAKLDIGIRHILPVMPFLLVLAAAGGVALAHRSRAWAWAVATLVLLHAASSLYAFPLYLPYSNEFFGGPSQTYRAASDANAGWGGGLKALHAYIEKNHITHCWLAYDAPPDPAEFQIGCKLLPTMFRFLVEYPQPEVPTRISGPVFIGSEEVGDFNLGGLDPYIALTKAKPSHVIAGEILEYDGEFDVSPVASFSQAYAAGILLRQKKSTEALLHAEKAVAEDPDSLFAHVILSQVYELDHQQDAAMREYDVAEHLFQTVHPEFQNSEFRPEKPGSPQ